MQEFPYQIEPAGLRQGPQERNTRWAEVSMNLEPCASGLQTTAPPLFIRGLPIEESHPFPQMLEIGGHLWLLGESTFYLVRQDGFVEKRLGGVSSTGHPWAAAVFPGYAIVTNEKTVVRLKGEYVLPEEQGLADRNKRVPASRAICAWQGQLISFNVWAFGRHQPTRWQCARVGSEDERVLAAGAGGGYVTWSGTGLAAHPLRQGPVLYGDGGISLLTPAPAPYYFGERVLADGVGIAGPLAVTGDLDRHIFIGRDGALYLLTAGGIKKLGYEDHLAAAAKACPSLCMLAEKQKIYARY